MLSFAVIPDTTAPIIVFLLAAGMALAFILADRLSPTRQAQAVFLAFVGVSIVADALWVLPMRRAEGVVPWEGWLAMPRVLAFIFAYEKVLRVRQTIPLRDLNTRGPDRLLRAAQGLAVLYGLTAVAFPELRAAHLGNTALETGEPLHPFFWLFSIPLGLSLTLGTAATLFTLNRRPDRAEGRRLIVFAISAPILAAAVILPAHIAPICGAVGLLVLLVGSVQCHVTQGQRAQFLSRFLSPQVAELFTRCGLKSATDEKALQISVVCCDLRGFTTFSAATLSRCVIGILREYYNAVSMAAATCGGTIKHQAGDGVLILVGAPIAFSDPRPANAGVGASDPLGWHRVDRPLVEYGDASGRGRRCRERLCDGGSHRWRVEAGICRRRRAGESGLAPVRGSFPTARCWWMRAPRNSQGPACKAAN